MKVPTVEAQVEGHSTAEDWQPRNSYHYRQVCYVFLAQAASGCRQGHTSVPKYADKGGLLSTERQFCCVVQQAFNNLMC